MFLTITTGTKRRKKRTISRLSRHVIASVINKQCKQCTLRLNSQNFTLMVTDENSSPKQVVIWCVLEATKFFSEYFVEGISESNEIYLLVPPEMLSMSLNTLKATNNNAKSVKLKLANKITPCLTVEIVLVALEMKTFKKLKAVLEKFRKLSPWVALSVTSEGNLSSSVTSSTATVTTLFKNTVASYSSEEVSPKWANPLRKWAPISGTTGIARMAVVRWDSSPNGEFDTVRSPFPGRLS
ncbi:unnamed protein product [Nesidiocoris tenuis]|uniref:Checkpoint protein n=1 Tax=Nesidiocoris tenuis TaxID=355587 RepID=A0A6H5H4P3_9HEMI|nr:unnamed protein product [Nesidiocoris tenuis]